jgi:hypothetical protein
MKIRLLIRSLLLVAAPVLASGQAQALLVAGWDFSQYLGDGLLTVDGVEGANTLPANYSNLDPTFSAGVESAAFGTLFINGQFGSSNVDPFAAAPELVPTAGSLASNLNAPVAQAGDVPFDSFTVLAFEGQLFQNELALIARDAVSAVFRVSVLQQGFDWSLSLGGKTANGTASVGVEFSVDGTSYAPAGTLSLDTNDTPFTLALSPTLANTLFVRLNFDPSGIDQPVIDNVAISAEIVPEPGTLLLLLSGMAGLVGFGRRV